MANDDQFISEPGWGPVEKRLYKALWSLKNGAPKNADLKELAAQGKLKVTLTSVAKEAGVSRTLIGMEKCAYPGVRKAVVGSKRSKVDELNRKIEALQEQVKDLEARLLARDSTNAEILLRARALQKGVVNKSTGANEKREAQQARKRALTLVSTDGIKSSETP